MIYREHYNNYTGASLLREEKSESEYIEILYLIHLEMQ